MGCALIAKGVNCKYDYEIANNGSLDDLGARADEFLKLVFNKN